MSSATATSLCKRLERDGLITKVRSESDNRQVYTTLTKEGVSFVESIAFSHKDWIVNLLDGVNKDELSQFFTLAKKISVELNSNIENISKKE
ncbi:MarR family winged helix-turn-helix transcriptional regulator [Pseudoalteromonas piscicida]|uniref:MarR family winged helix-turn-helix transcriptional regulator n=1 Tax=Pseudoalteromonas piscicida TaxID=43662 RepID=UPI0027E44CD0|nr:MarR family transcriptional regulator [Pseudoalteromonas piscicida]WMO16850.1 MarR family transcriptional regulator [Pseudoalteromonas piscicida]